MDFDELVEEWHPIKNLPLIFNASLKTSEKYWWIGKCGHEWDTPLRNRQIGQGCPHCSNKRVLVGFNDLASQKPELAAEWHPTKNGELTPTQVTHVSGKKVWWLGICSHEWETSVAKRSTRGSGCPVCLNQILLLGFNDLATTNPTLAAEWHPTKNGELTPTQVTAGAAKKVWWQCAEGHEWEARLYSRNSGRGCAVCAGLRLFSGYNDLASQNPSLASEWHPTKNGGLTPMDITSKVNRKVWWLGKCGHEWEAKISNRSVRGDKCPICINIQVLVGHNDLASQYPEIAAEWHPTKNGDLKPDAITSGSGRKVWWLGKCSHEWEAKPSYRTSRGHNCPICTNRKVLQKHNDLASQYPEIAAEWHPTKNGDLKPDAITSGSGRKVWWLGKCGHEWQVDPYHRAFGGSTCPTCRNRQIASGFNDLATTNPALAAEWHPTRNSPLTPQHIGANSNAKVWWQCDKGHDWRTTVVSRSKGSGCSICKNRLIKVGFNDLATTNPALAAEWHPTKNKSLTPEQVTEGTHRKVWWQCKEGHEWETRITKRKIGHGCHVCSNQLILDGFNDLASQNPSLAAEWHPTKNGLMTPQHIRTHSKMKVWWLGKCGHEWEARVQHQARKQKCLVCTNMVTLSGFNDLATINPTLAAEWHPTKNGSMTPQNVRPNVTAKVWWLGSCGHEWKAAINGRNKGKKCPICANLQILIGYNDLNSQNPVLAAEWHPVKNGNLTPADVTLNTERKVWWLGACAHEWEATVYHRNTRNQGCSRCSASASISKAEQQICDYVFSLDSNMEVIQSDRTVLGNGKELDIYIPSKKVAIEFNGLFWHSEKSGKEKTYHYDKWRICKSNGIHLIQIWEDEWIQTPEKIKRMISHSLGFFDQSDFSPVAFPITEQKAEEFLNIYHMAGYISASHYLGLASSADADDLHAVLLLEKNHRQGEEDLRIIRYASQVPDSKGFAKLLSYAIEEYAPNSLSVIDDHCASNSALYEANGFIIEDEIHPEFMYVVRDRRYNKLEFSMNRFINDPKLEWVTGQTEVELAHLNSLDRIWDAGKTRYRLYV